MNLWPFSRKTPAQRVVETLRPQVQVHINSIGCNKLSPETIQDIGRMAKTVAAAANASGPKELDTKTFGNASGLKPVAETIIAKVKAHLIKHGSITNYDCFLLGTVDGRKIFSDLRKQGLLYPANDPKGFREEPNASGKGTHRRHLLRRVDIPGVST